MDILSDFPPAAVGAALACSCLCGGAVVWRQCRAPTKPSQRSDEGSAQQIVVGNDSRDVELRKMFNRAKAEAAALEEGKSGALPAETNTNRDTILFGPGPSLGESEGFAAGADEFKVDEKEDPLPSPSQVGKHADEVPHREGIPNQEHLEDLWQTFQDEERRRNSSAAKESPAALDDDLEATLAEHQAVLRLLRKERFEINPARYKEDGEYRAGVKILKRAVEKWAPLLHTATFHPGCHVSERPSRPLFARLTQTCVWALPGMGLQGCRQPGSSTVNTTAASA